MTNEHIHEMVEKMRVAFNQLDNIADDHPAAEVKRKIIEQDLTTRACLLGANVLCNLNTIAESMKEIARTNAIIAGAATTFVKLD